MEALGTRSGRTKCNLAGDLINWLLLLNYSDPLDIFKFNSAIQFQGKLALFYYIIS